MKKIIALALSLLMLLAVLTSCGSDENTQSTGDGVNTSDIPDDGLPAVDMGGFELGILTHDTEWFTWAEITMAVDNYDANRISSEIYKRNLSIEERFKCYLNIDSQAGIDKNYIENLSLSGDSSSGAHVIMYYDKWVVGAAAYFRDWNAVDYIDLSQDYWNPGITQMFDINGKQIALSGVFSLGMLSRTETVIFDKQMYANYAAVDPTMYDSMYEYVTKDEWTLETLYQIAAKAVHSDDETWDEQDSYGISASKKELYTSLMIGSGIRFVQKDQNGKPTFTTGTDASAVDKLQKLLQLNQNNDIHYDKSTNAHYPDPELFFENGHTLFAIRALFDIPKARQMMESEFGILPLPKYDTDQTEYYSACFGGDVACLLNTVSENDLDNIGIIMEAMAYHSNENLVPTYKVDLLQTRYASDLDSYAMLDIIFETTYCDMGITVLEDTVSFYLIKQIYVPEKDVISSELQTLNMIMPATLDNMFKAIE
ncbi:MAG: hypothetical protein IJY08_04810 [Clostridia bacterium]|nr:hypothetical protein [Clostridia bacterium]